MHALGLRRLCIPLLFLVICSAAGVTWWYVKKHRIQMEEKQKQKTSTDCTPKPQGSPDLPVPPERANSDRQAFERAADYAQRITDSVLLVFGG